MFYEQENVLTLADVPAFGRAQNAQEEPEETAALSWNFADAAALTGNARKNGDSFLKR